MKKHILPIFCLLLHLTTGTEMTNFLLDNALSYINNDVLISAFNGEESDCGDDVVEYLSTLASLKFTKDTLWAWKMFDSTAKIPIGILTANLVSMGQFDECLSVVHPSKNVVGQHCMLRIDIPITIARAMEENNAFPRKIQTKGFPVPPFMFGICVPSSCTAEDINAVMDKIGVKAYTNYENCWTDEKYIPLTTGGWVFIGVLIFLCALAVLSTIYDGYQRFYKENDKPSPLMCSFSLYSNSRALFAISNANPDTASLHGMRTFSMMWVVLCHTYEKAADMPTIDLTVELEVLNNFDHILISNGYFSVDSFFFLSGLLVAFVFFRNIGKNGYFDAPMSYVHRYLRLTPQFLVIILWYALITESMAKGPLWNKMDHQQPDACRQYWWTSILYVHNYNNPYINCVDQSWYLAVDMQLFWISPIILYPLYLWPKFGVGFLTSLTIGSTLWTFAQDWALGFQADVETTDNPDQFALEYIATHTRMAPWLVGLALGYLVCVIKAKKIKIKLSKTKVMAGWLSSTVVCLTCIFSYYRFRDGRQYEIVESAFFLAFTRLAWGLGLGWIAFACIHGYGGVVNSFLSAGIFQPLGKLSYCVYVIHTTLHNYRIGTMRTNVYTGDFEVTYFYLADVVLSHLIAMILYLLVEAPVAILDRELLNGVKIFPYPRPKPKKENLETIETVLTEPQNIESSENKG